jgi:hypothetical protein
MIEHGGFLGHPDRVVRCHHITELPNTDVLRPRPPERIHDAGTGADFIAFGMKMMLDGGHAPKPELVGLFNDIAPAAQSALEQFRVAPDGTHGHTFGFGGRRHDRVHLNDYLHHG